MAGSFRRLLRNLRRMHESKNMDKPTDQQLIDAGNLICEYVAEHMAEGWELMLVMNSEESYFTLLDADSEEVEFDYGDSSSVVQACETSHEECD